MEPSGSAKIIGLVLILVGIVDFVLLKYIIVPRVSKQENSTPQTEKILNIVAIISPLFLFILGFLFYNGILGR